MNNRLISFILLVVISFSILPAQDSIPISVRKHGIKFYNTSFISVRRDINVNNGTISDVYAQDLVVFSPSIGYQSFESKVIKEIVLGDIKLSRSAITGNLTDPSGVTTEIVNGKTFFFKTDIRGELIWPMIGTANENVRFWLGTGFNVNPSVVTFVPVNNSLFPTRNFSLKFYPTLAPRFTVRLSPRLDFDINFPIELMKSDLALENTENPANANGKRTQLSYDVEVFPRRFVTRMGILLKL